MEALWSSMYAWGLGERKDAGLKPSRWRSVGVNVGVGALVVLLYVTRYNEDGVRAPPARTGRRDADSGDTATSATAAAVATAAADVEATVDGCPDAHLRASWDENCIGQVDLNPTHISNPKP
jgi:hypothetical protein